MTLYQAPGFDDRGGLARALLTLACVRAREGEPERAVIVLLRAVAVTEPGGELHLPVIHELALNLCASGLHEFARALVEANRHRYLKAGKRMRTRLCWLDGKIALGTGEMGQAEACLNTARLAFLRQRKRSRFGARLPRPGAGLSAAGPASGGPMARGTDASDVATREPGAACARLADEASPRGVDRADRDGRGDAGRNEGRSRFLNFSESKARLQFYSRGGPQGSPLLPSACPFSLVRRFCYSSRV